MMINFTDTTATAVELQGYSEAQIDFLRSIADECRDLAEAKADYADELDALANED